MLARVDHNLLVVAQVHPRPLVITARNLMMETTLHPMRPRVTEAMMHVVLSRVVPMQPLMTKAMRCDERLHLECNRSLDDYILIEFVHYV
jgi:hypothetical protein